MLKRTSKYIFGIFLFVIMLGLMSFNYSVEGSSNAVATWANLIDQAKELGLPTKFLKEVDPKFVTVVFEDLRTYAAEYHPEDHRMILNMRLSFNKAGGALMDLDRMTHHDVSLLYHELFHAYLDYVFNSSDQDGLSANAKRLLAFAKEQLRCHYRFLRISPIRQRRDISEVRFLSKHDAWEVLNETWAVFVGWQIWTKLEQSSNNKGVESWTAMVTEDWAIRLKAAIQSGELLGYYEPDDPEERRLVRKRFIAPSHGITPAGARLLLEIALEEPKDVVEKGGFIIKENQDISHEELSCD